jgi:hypothetical protein
MYLATRLYRIVTFQLFMANCRFPVVIMRVVMDPAFGKDAPKIDPGLDAD